jgi:hypothetical protein
MKTRTVFMVTSLAGLGMLFQIQVTGDSIVWQTLPELSPGEISCPRVQPERRQS